MMQFNIQENLKIRFFVSKEARKEVNAMGSIRIMTIPELEEGVDTCIYTQGMIYARSIYYLLNFRP